LWQKKKEQDDDNNKKLNIFAEKIRYFIQAYGLYSQKVTLRNNLLTAGGNRKRNQQTEVKFT
jgi:hypothetical protein